MALIFCEYSSTNIYSRASTNFWSDDYMAIILLKSATNIYVSVRTKEPACRLISTGVDPEAWSGGSTKQPFYSPSYTLPLWNKHVVLLMCNCAIPSK